MVDAPRWLDADAVAQYISVPVHHVPKLAKAGKLPAPSMHLGARSPRWDRAALDSAFGLAKADGWQRGVVSDAAQKILAKGRARGQKSHGGRVNQGIPIRGMGA